MALRSGYKGIKKLAAGLKWNRPGILAADNTALAKAFFPRSEQAVLGAKNIIPYPYASKSNTNNGITWTENDGIVTASGIATGNSSFTLTDWGYVPNKFIGMRLTGCPSGGSFTGYRILVNYSNDGTTWVKSGYDIGNGYVIENYPYIDIKAYIPNGTDLSTPKTFEPMISFDGGEYVEPAMTNRELTDKVQGIINAATNAADFAAFKTAMGAITPVTRSLSKDASSEDPAEVIEEKTTKKTTKKTTVKEGE